MAWNRVNGALLLLLSYSHGDDSNNGTTTSAWGSLLDNMHVHFRGKARVQVYKSLLTPEECQHIIAKGV